MIVRRFCIIIVHTWESQSVQGLDNMKMRGWPRQWWVIENLCGLTPCQQTFVSPFPSLSFSSLFLRFPLLISTGFCMQSIFIVRWVVHGALCQSSSGLECSIQKVGFLLFRLWVGITLDTYIGSVSHAVQLAMVCHHTVTWLLLLLLSFRGLTW